ncbi:hypothetical protein V6N13_092552 [Hibiscus sabdariffa]|uniref:Plastid lipid-associated protein/fibrillin conserved domain-containing protein n=1 Tax=Hibiscus sabdariffa TaxID=183260 RepID=A0ABR2NBW9_9ROSI
MAAAVPTSFNFPCGITLATAHHRTFPSLLPPKSRILTQKSVRTRPVFQVRTAYFEQWEKEPEPVTPVVDEEKPKEATGTESLKKALVGYFNGTDRGMNATSETRAEIVELICQLESENPTPAPTESLPLLDGKWILVYTSFPGLFPLLSSGQLPLVKVEEVSQTIDAETLTVENSVLISGPLASSSISTNAKFEIKFQEGIIGTPQLTDFIVLPENVEFMGQNIDLTPIKGLLATVQHTISSQPPLKIPLSNSNAESWLLTTYLDEDLRISREDAGRVFVLIKQGSALLAPP